MTEKQTTYKLTSTRSDYITPRYLIDEVLNHDGINEFDLDVCCNKENIPAKEYYKAEVNEETGEVINIISDGLKLPWKKYNWMNPPFNESKKWIKKAIQEQQKGNTTWAIIPFRPETAYWDFILCSKGTLDDRVFENEFFKCIFYRKGLCFVNPVTKEKMGVYKNPLALVKFKGLKCTAECVQEQLL